jgi:hypothetical protein
MFIILFFLNLWGSVSILHIECRIWRVSMYTAAILYVYVESFCLACVKQLIKLLANIVHVGRDFFIYVTIIDISNIQCDCTLFQLSDDIFLLWIGSVNQKLGILILMEIVISLLPYISNWLLLRKRREKGKRRHYHIMA